MSMEQDLSDPEAEHWGSKAGIFENPVGDQPFSCLLTESVSIYKVHQHTKISK